MNERGTIQELRGILAQAKEQHADVIQKEQAARRTAEACERERYAIYDTAYTAWRMLQKLGAAEAGEDSLGLEGPITGLDGGDSRRDLRLRSLVHELGLIHHALGLSVGDGLTSIR